MEFYNDARDVKEMEYFLCRIGMPEDGTKTFLEAFNKIVENDLVYSYNTLCKASAYCQLDDWGASEYLMMPIARVCGFSDPLMYMMLVIRSFMYLEKRYKENGIPEEIYWDSAIDVKCKAVEHYTGNGEWGTLVAWWYPGFFSLKCMKLGRFEYEEGHARHTFKFKGVPGHDEYVLNKGSLMYNIHIPSTGISLTDEVRMDSYRKAWEYHKHEFSDGIMPLSCGTWLLYPGHREALPETSGVRRFMNDFHIYHSFENNPGTYGEVGWRVFSIAKPTPLEEFPRDTGLRRVYHDYLLAGGKTGEGDGIFLFDGEKIYKDVIEITD